MTTLCYVFGKKQKPTLKIWYPAVTKIDIVDYVRKDAQHPRDDDDQ
jgi:hypothetical protein